jgi:hypothetical protein
MTTTCPVCQGPHNCTQHFVGWTEDRETVIPERRPLRPDDIVVNTGHNLRVYTQQNN